MFFVLSNPKPPMDFGLHTVGQFTRWYLRFGPEPSQKNLDLSESNLAWMPSWRRKRPIANIGRLSRQALDSVKRPPEDSNLLSQGSILVPNFLTRKSHCSMVSFLSDIGSPRYMKGKAPRLQLSKFAMRICSASG
jgi:hypothetical protein